MRPVPAHVIEDIRMRRATGEYWVECSCGRTIALHPAADANPAIDFATLLAVMYRVHQADPTAKTNSTAFINRTAAYIKGGGYQAATVTGGFH